MRKSALVIAVGIAIAAGSALAQQYRWTDQQGRVHYTDTPPPPSAKDVRKKGAPPPAGTPVVPFDLARAQKESPVTLYTHPSCEQTCQFARDVLNKRGVPFDEVVVSTAQALEQLKALSGNNHVPVLTVGSRVEKEVSLGTYNAALDAGGYPKEGLLPPRKQAAPGFKLEDLETAGPDYRPAGQKPPAQEAAPQAEAPSQPRGPYAPGASRPAPKPAAKSQ